MITPKSYFFLFTPSTARSNRSTFSFSSQSPKSQKKYPWSQFCGCLMTLFVLYCIVTIFVSSKIWSWSDITDRKNNNKSIVSLNNINDNNVSIESLHNKSLHNKSLHNKSWRIINKFNTNKEKCDGIFGNAFFKHIFECSANRLSSSSNFKCFQNPISRAMYCSAKNIIIDPKYIKVSKGGEEITDVIGRREDDEYPKYGNFAFNIGCHLHQEIEIPKKDPVSFYLSDIMENIKTSDNIRYDELYDGYCHKNKNETYIKTIVLFTMRYEYANIYHTATDWYNMYQIIRSLDINPDEEEIKIIWLDGHSKSALDDAWKFAFGDYLFVKQLKDITCLREAIFIPAGYTGGISLQSMQKNGCTQSIQYVIEFRDWFTRNIMNDKEIINTNDTIKISIICRMDYLAHPRNKNKGISRKFEDDEIIENVVKKAISQRGIFSTNLNVNVNRIYLEKMSIKEQLLQMMETNILIGAHGAGLTHLLFLQPNSTVIEIMTPSKYGNEHYKHLSNWAGHNYIRMECGEYNGYVQPNQVALENNVINAIHFFLQRN